MPKWIVTGGARFVVARNDVVEELVARVERNAEGAAVVVQPA